MEKKNVAFLSFADPDRDLAESISKLFWGLGEPTYFAPVDLPKSGSPQWRQEIISAIKSSYSFVPIYTRHSLRRLWVLYESGVADSVGLPRFAARVSSVSPADIDYLPSGSALYYDLSNEDSLADLITNVCLSKSGERAEVSARVLSIIKKSQSIVQRILTLAKTRWVFIAGNTPKNLSQREPALTWYKTQAHYRARLWDFIEALTEALLENGFSITSCPQVPDVGMRVTEKALSSLDSKRYFNPVNFRISGIYPIDREAREITLSQTAKKKWLDHILEFRRSYLADQEWLIVIGGNVGTSDEHAAALDCGVKVFPVPCFGGTATQIYNSGKTPLLEPCKSCSKKDGSCGSEGINRLIESLKVAIL